MLETITRLISKTVNALLLGAVQFYRWTLSPYFRRQCRFEPTCSAYAMEALRCHGPVKGSWLTIKRLCRCRPYGGFGFDPVPGRAKSGASDT